MSRYCLVVDQLDLYKYLLKQARWHQTSTYAAVLYIIFFTLLCRPLLYAGAYCEDCRISKPVAMGEDLKLAHDLCGVIDKQLDMALTKGKFVD